MATGVVSMTGVPPSVVYSLSSPSSASPHILSKHTASSTTTTTAAAAMVHPQQLHLDRQPDRLLPPNRAAERQADTAMHLDRPPERQSQNLSSGNPVAPPSGPVGSLQPISPPMQIQASGACFLFVCKHIPKLL